MATLKIHLPAEWANEKTSQKNTLNIWAKWLAFADSQAPYKTAWFLVSLIAQGVLFLPIPAVLMYYYQIPLVVCSRVLRCTSVLIVVSILICFYSVNISRNCL